jgi:DNA mismatch repair protein MutL
MVNFRRSWRDFKLQVDPTEIDVNVSPSKSQVKFRDGHAVYQAIHRTLRSALETAPWTPQIKRDTGDLAPLELGGGGDPVFGQSVFKSKSAFTPNSGFTPLSIPVLRESAASRENFSVAQTSVPYEIKPFWSQVQVLSQANLTYILAQSRQSLFVIDQHAAHERIAYERLMKVWKNGETDVQGYLLPLVIHFQPDEVEALMSHRAELERLKLTIEQAGPTAISVQSAPSILKERAIQAALQKVAAEIVSSQGSFGFEKAVSDICATLACHSVIRAGQALSLEEMKALIVQMDEFTLSGYCPHGRPVYIEHPFAQMDRQFGRIV